MMYLKNRLRKNSAEGGFTLVETLVAVSILVIVVLGPMNIAMTGLQNAFFANERTTAIYLAQEAIESIEKLRDDNALDVFLETRYGTGSGETETWAWYEDTGGNPLHPHCKFKESGDKKCDYDVLNDTYVRCNGPTNNCRLNYDDKAESGYNYVYDNSLPLSIYTREIRLEDVDTTRKSVQISVTVTWNTRLFSSGQKSITLTAWLYDHYNRYE